MLSELRRCLMLEKLVPVLGREIISLHLKSEHKALQKVLIVRKAPETKLVRLPCISWADNLGIDFPQRQIPAL
jgi:hypothetical protein